MSPFVVLAGGTGGWGGGQSGGGGASGGWNENRVASLEAWRITHDRWAGDLSKRVTDGLNFAGSERFKLAQRLQSLEDWRNAHNAWAGTLSSRVGSLEGKMGNLESWKVNHDNWAKALRERVDSFGGRIGNLESWKVNHDAWASKLSARLDDHNVWAGQLSKKVTDLQDWKTAHNAWASKLTDRMDAHDKWAQGVRERVDNLSSRVSSLETWKDAHDKWAQKLGEWRDAHNEWADGLSDKVYAAEKDIKDLKSFQTAHNEWAANFKADTNSKFTALNEKVTSLSGFTDVAIIASINLQGKNNTDLWYSDDYGSSDVKGNDGKAVSLFKRQFDELRNYLGDMLKAYFGSNGIFTSLVVGPQNQMVKLLNVIADKKFTTDISPDFSHLYYFKDILEVLKGFRDDFNGKNNKVIVDGLKEQLESIIYLLREIEEKPINLDGSAIKIPEIKIPPIEIPDIDMKTEGGNFWKALSELIKGIADVLGKAIDAVSDNLGKLIDLVSDLTNAVIRLVVPENLDFMHKKFDGVQNEVKLKFKFLFSGVDSFKGLLSNQRVIEDVPMQISIFGKGDSVNIPLSFITKFSPFFKPIITGFVALEFLIDMYKWFHMRGEVVE